MSALVLVPRRGGVLALSSCSSHINFPLFHEVITYISGAPVHTCMCSILRAARSLPGARPPPLLLLIICCTRARACMHMRRRSARRPYPEPAVLRQCWVCTASQRTTLSQRRALSCDTSSLWRMGWISQVTCYTRPAARWPRSSTYQRQVPPRGDGDDLQAMVIICSSGARIR